MVAGAGSLQAEDSRSSTVGLPARIGPVVLPGGELEVKPLVNRRSPVVLRIVASQPSGDGYRYEFEYYGLEPGRYDLRDYLHRKDRSEIESLPPLRVTVQSVLPPGQVKPHDLDAAGSPRLGGYRVLLIAGGGLWALGLAAVLLVGRRRRLRPLAVRPRTLADYLRPLVLGAQLGRLKHAQLAELERALIFYWTRRMGLGESKPAAALGELRRHPEAGPLLRQLESWLHRPHTAGTIDVHALLAPYHDLPADGMPVLHAPEPQGRPA